MIIALFIGRFQPLHKGHLSVIRRISEESDKIIIGIGSAQYTATKNNPLSFEDRKSIIDHQLENEEINYEIKAIPDFHEDDEWMEYIKETLDFDVVHSGNSLVKELFEKKGYKVKSPEFLENINGTTIRELILIGEDYEKFIPEKAMKKIIELDGIRKIRDSGRTIKVTVDIIIKFKGGIVLIERKNKPSGWALPGGFVDHNESLEEAAKREAKEETGLDLKGMKQFHTYSNPKRDPRHHTITTVYTAEGTGELKAGDDARKAKVSQKEDLPKLAFDHKMIIEDYFNNVY